jgi:hypothetical protein
MSGSKIPKPPLPKTVFLKSMPRVHRQMLLPQNMEPLAHDVGGKLRDLHLDAMARMFGAQFLKPANPTNPEYVRAVEGAIACLYKARAGWLQVRTAEFPAGDVEGAGKEAMALAGFALELDRLGDALRWLTRAEHELGEEHKSAVEHNMDFVLLHVEQEYESILLRENFKVWSAKAAFCKRDAKQVLH